MSVFFPGATGDALFRECLELTRSSVEISLSKCRLALVIRAIHIVPISLLISRLFSLSLYCSLFLFSFSSIHSFIHSLFLFVFPIVLAQLRTCLWRLGEMRLTQ